MTVTAAEFLDRAFLYLVLDARPNARLNEIIRAGAVGTGGQSAQRRSRERKADLNLCALCGYFAHFASMHPLCVP